MDDMEAFYYGGNTDDLEIGYCRQDVVGKRFPPQKLLATEWLNNYLLNQPGLPIAALYVENGRNEGWHRAVITGIENLTDVSVYYVDYGTSGVVHLFNCKFLLRRFAKLPIQVSSIFRAHAGVLPDDC